MDGCHFLPEAAAEELAAEEPPDAAADEDAAEPLQSPQCQLCLDLNLSFGRGHAL